MPLGHFFFVAHLPRGLFVMARCARRAMPRYRAPMRHALLLIFMCLCTPVFADDAELQVGSKRFTESYILGEVVAQTAQQAGAVAEHRQGLGNTAVVFEALKAGAIDVYPEYLGTIAAEILKQPALNSVAALRAGLAQQGLGVTASLGFSNGYALAMQDAQARQLDITRLSDLKAHPQLALGLSHEFLGRQDGWPGLAARYGLPQQPVGIDHGIAYEALESGRIAATDIYTTDAKIKTLGLRVLADDLAFFPRYDAVLLYRLDVPQRFPAAWKALTGLEGRITAAKMIEMNGQAELQGMPFAQVAQGFLEPSSLAAPQGGLVQRLFADDLGRLTAQHLLLVSVAVLVACAIGIPVGAAAASLPRLEQPVMAVVGLLQTVPSLALLAMLIPLLGRIGTVPALVALALYALLPIVRNTTTGLRQVPAGLRDAGTALGLTAAQRWRCIDLPLAAPVILAGIKTAAVISVGMATIAAFIGAGGYGERIVTGLALNDHTALLAGAIPAALLALVMQLAFELAERGLLRRSAGGK